MADNNSVGKSFCSRFRNLPNQVNLLLLIVTCLITLVGVSQYLKFKDFTTIIGKEEKPIAIRGIINHNILEREHEFVPFSTCFMEKESKPMYYICGRNHNIVPALNFHNFYNEIVPFLDMFSKRLHYFVTDGYLNNRFSLWSFLRILKPAHVIESGANRGYGTWIIRKALPDSKITVISPSTPHDYKESNKSSKYFTGKTFTDFKNIKWESEAIDFDNTVIYFDDHQSIYKRLTQAKKAGFKHIIFDDNYLPGNTQNANNNLSVKQACDLGGCLSKKNKEFHTTEHVDNFGMSRVPMPDNSNERKKIGLFLDKNVQVIYEPPYLCDTIIKPQTKEEEVTHEVYKKFIKPLLPADQCLNARKKMKYPIRKYDKYANLVYIQLK